MKKLISLLLLGVTLSASAQKHNCEHGKACANCENPYKHYTQQRQCTNVSRPSGEPEGLRCRR